MQYQAQLHQFQREMEEQARRYAELQAEQQRREELAEERRAAEQKDLVEQQRKNMEQALAAQAKAQEESTQRILEQMIAKLTGMQSSPQFLEPRPAAAALPVRLCDRDVLAQISPSGLLYGGLYYVAANSFGV
jgi:multidrug efflux pump subunit AcrA (membrane-fusion protein)